MLVSRIYALVFIFGLVSIFVGCNNKPDVYSELVQDAYAFTTETESVVVQIFRHTGNKRKLAFCSVTIGPAEELLKGAVTVDVSKRQFLLNSSPVLAEQFESKFFVCRGSGVQSFELMEDFHTNDDIFTYIRDELLE